MSEQGNKRGRKPRRRQEKGGGQSFGGPKKTVEAHVVLGVRAVIETLRSAATVEQVLVSETRKNSEELREVAQLASDRNLPLSPVKPTKLDQLAKGLRHQGVVALLPEFRYRALDDLLGAPRPLITALDQISDPHNFGAIVRSTVAFGASGIITLKNRAAPVTATVVRASAGATEHASIVQVTNLARTLRELKEQGLTVTGLAGEGEGNLHSLAPAPHGRVLVVGSEGKGLRRLVRETCDSLVRIDLRGPVSSLNASVAAGIALHHCSNLDRAPESSGA